jgi:hypothetical protein
MRSLAESIELGTKVRGRLLAKTSMQTCLTEAQLVHGKQIGATPDHQAACPPQAGSCGFQIKTNS